MAVAWACEEIGLQYRQRVANEQERAQFAAVRAS